MINNDCSALSQHLPPDDRMHVVFFVLTRPLNLEGAKMDLK